MVQFTEVSSNCSNKRSFRSKPTMCQSVSYRHYSPFNQYKKNIQTVRRNIYQFWGNTALFGGGFIHSLHETVKTSAFKWTSAWCSQQGRITDRITCSTRSRLKSCVPCFPVGTLANRKIKYKTLSMIYIFMWTISLAGRSQQVLLNKYT